MAQGAMPASGRDLTVGPFKSTTRIRMVSAIVRRMATGAACLLIVACGGGGGGGGGAGGGSSGQSQSGQPQNSAIPAPTLPASAWTARAAFGGTYGGTPTFGQSLDTANDGQAHFLFGEWQNTTTISLKAFHKPSLGPWDGGLTLAGPATEPSANARRYESPVVRVDDSGNALALWTYHDISDPSDRNFISQVFFSRRDAVSGIWSAPKLLQTATSAYAFSPQLVMEANGIAWAVWVERTVKDTFFPSNDRFALFAAKFDPVRGWSAAEKLTGDLQSRLDAKITTDRHENPRIIIAWNNGLAVQSTLYVARRLASGAWAPLETIAVATPAGGLAPDYSEYDLVIDADDNAVAVWREYDGTRYLILTRHYTLLAGWEPTIGLQPGGRDSGFGPQITMDGNGNGFVAWHQFDGVQAYGIWAARFEKVSGWTALNIINSPTFTIGEDSTFPRIACDAAGNAIAIWTKYDFRLNQTIVRSNYFSLANGWGSDETISTGSGISFQPLLAVSNTGYATASWWQESQDPSSPNTFQAWSASRPVTP